VSRRHQIANRLAAYSGVKTILSAMKSIAMMELHKLGEQRERQLIIMATVEKVAADFMTSYTLPVESGRKVLIAIGSERGFCGKFNEELLPGIHQAQDSGDMVLMIGSQLGGYFDLESDAPDLLPGPNITEEIPAVLETVAHWLEDAQSVTPEAPLQVSVFSHDQDGPTERAIAPLPLPQYPAPPHPFPPVLTLPPREFLGKLIEEAMLLALQEVFTLSLASENRHRLEHMDNALRRLGEMTETLERRMNAARQEDIVQEIETILLGSYL